jgi:serine/threonine-protein kinase
MKLEAGAIVAGRYRAARLLGQGGMGEVWAAVHLITGKQVALKLMKAEKATRPDAVQRFFREARAATVVGHANVVEVHDVFSFEGAPIMVMELLEGESLGDRLRREGCLSLAELASVLVPVVSAVGTAHARGIVHRDLKPENIFLARASGGAVTPKVLDFGIAKLVQDDLLVESGALTRTGSMVGTPFYMSPEQAAGERDFDHRCDTWALGVICFEALVGKRPFEGDNFGQIFKRIITEQPASLRALCPELPADVSDCIDGMLVKERALRGELREVMRVLGAHAATTAPDFGPPREPGASSVAQPLDAATGSVLAGGDEATLDEAATRDAVLEPLLGTLGATTLGQPHVARSRLTSAQTKLSLGAVALGLLTLASGVTWSLTRGTRQAAPAGVAAASSFAEHADASAPPLTAASLLTAPSAPTASPVASAAAARVTPRPVGLKTSSRPKSEPPSAAASAAEAPLKRLPGGILDQEKAPF